jgi:hypothetical protein
MKINFGNTLSRGFHVCAFAIAAGGILAAACIQASPSNTIVLVPPRDLPELARRSGEGMLLHESVDGKTLLYVEQTQGAGLATFDVTDPAHIKGVGTVQLHASGPFDFVSPLGDQAELIRFRLGHEEAVLDLHEETVPKLKPLHGVTLKGSVTPLGNDGITTTGLATEMDRDYQVLETSNSEELNRVFDMKRVRAEMTNTATGTTFLLEESGLYVIRRPDVEWRHQLMKITPN